MTKQPLEDIKKEEHMDNFPYKIGDKLRIIKMPRSWNSGLGGINPLNKIKINDIITITAILKDSPSGFNGKLEGDDNFYGFTYSQYVKDCYKLVEEKTKMRYEKSKDFTAEDLRKAGACDYLIEEIIKYFGFTKIVPFNKDSIQIMENIKNCILFLKRRGFISNSRLAINYLIL